MTGGMEGAISYLIAGYVLTWTVLIGYAVSLWVRKKK